MILSRGRRYLFIHSPKTGGTSMALALEGRAMKDDVLLGDTPKARKRRHKVQGVQTRGRLWKHSTLADLDGLVRPEELDNLFIFTLVRNPWDRMVSYYHWLQTQTFDHPAVALAQSHGFHDFVCHPDTKAAWRSTPARHFVTDATGRERCNLFLRLEHLAQDAIPLWDHLGFALDIPHVNASTRRPDFRAYYTDASCEAVAHAASEDIARFGYRFT